MVESESIIDWNAALQASGGDSKTLAEITELFLEEAPRLMTEIRAAFQHNDPKALELHAHTLKGSLIIFGARVTADAAGAVELQGGTGILDPSPAMLELLEASLNRVLAEMRYPRKS